MNPNPTLGYLPCLPEQIRPSPPFATHVPPIDFASTGCWLTPFPSADHWKCFPVQPDPRPRTRRDDLDDAYANREKTRGKGPCALDPRPTVQLCAERRAPISRRQPAPPTIDGHPDTPMRDVDVETRLQKGLNQAHACVLPDDLAWAVPYFAVRFAEPETQPGRRGGLFRQWTSGKTAEAW